MEIIKKKKKKKKKKSNLPKSILYYPTHTKERQDQRTSYDILSEKAPILREGFDLPF